MTKKKTPVKKKAAKKVAAKKAPAKKVASKAKAPAKKTVKKAAKKATSEAQTVKKAEVTRAVSTDDKKATPIVFSIDDIEALVASRKDSEVVEEKKPKKAAKKVVVKKAPAPEIEDKPVEKRVLGAASLADILGFNPAEKKKKDPTLDEGDVPKKWIKFYKLLIDLRNHVRDELDLHTADTLKHSSREESGDLSGFGNHQADAATDTFDRDFALSLVSSEQDALNEIEEAIQRIKDGTYGVCEVTGEPINKERLVAVPFARFSVEGQSEYEKNRRRKIDRAATGLFGDATDTPKMASDDDED